MDAKILAASCFDQLKGIAQFTPASQVTLIELTIGSTYQVDPRELADVIEELLEEDHDQKIADAVVNVKIVNPGDTYKMPSRDDEHIATGWELLVSNLKTNE